MAQRVRGHVEPPPPPPSLPLPQAPREPETPELTAADSAELDSLRGALVHELDRLAAADDCSASFRRA